MLEPRAGRWLVLMSFLYCVVVGVWLFRQFDVKTLFIPTVVAAFPFVAIDASEGRTLRLVSASLLGLFAFIAGFSVGIWFVPAAAVMAIAYARADGFVKGT